MDLWGVGGKIAPSAFRAELLLERGDVDGARRTIDAVGLPDDPPKSLDFNWFLAARVRVLLAEGDFEAALARADDCGRRFDGPAPNPAWMPWRTLEAEALDRLGRSDEAAALAAEEVELARRWGAPRTLGRALRIQGVAERGEGIPRLREAVAVLETSPARLEHARALATLGTALRHARKYAEAREPLRLAAQQASACGASVLADHAGAELAATGARRQAEPLSGLAGLTPSERRVAALAAAGASNRDIAQELYVTVKTVEVHLSSTYRKLGIGSRHELAGALANGAEPPAGTP
jgi:DNA-binding CsgD family transcriptional regulator